jgi:DNA-3-methyladenine glycosylase II
VLFECMPTGEFDLANQNQYFGGWPTIQNYPQTLVMTFPVEGWKGSAAVSLRQEANGKIVGQVHGAAEISEKAKTQALASLSLDIAAEDWPEVGKRDAVIGELQHKYRFLRPILFHSPYEAAAGFIIGHRRSIRWKVQIMNHLAEELGKKLVVEGQVFHAFPEPAVLLTLKGYAGLNEQKVERLHSVARSALDGLLDRDRLRALPIDDALSKLETLPGVGPFFAQGILHRGAGLVDDMTRDDLTSYAIQKAYQLSEAPDQARIDRISQPWRPFRMWATILLHIWVRREIGVPPGRRASSTRSV